MNSCHGKCTLSSCAYLQRLERERIAAQPPIDGDHLLVLVADQQLQINQLQAEVRVLFFFC
jgi:hypothetical protein